MTESCGTLGLWPDEEYRLKVVQLEELLDIRHCVFVMGPPGAGKTALAASLALNSSFPFVKIVSPNGLVGMGEAAKAAHIARVFDDAHKSPLSLIVLDDLERLLEYVRIGPRFSNIVLQTLLTCVKKVPRTAKLIVLATSSSAQTLESLELRASPPSELAGSMVT